ncbi:bactofilin family protein [Maribellus maritimus]|uniref:bactofilin family protein n=1 Tax=Maribellus maritimus TaxID=2870838 RepID=UPI001EEC76F9|nr:polymer-forming cytoskeletal protein [Maribellus maritimus]MCG6188165.1 polymer-forming cytoskeletal protein [Maribellus maritimus]
MAKQTTKPYDETQPQINIIGEGTVINGNISASGDIRIDGTLEGNITAKGKLVIGPKGKIIGEIDSNNVEVAGYTKGKIRVLSVLCMKSTAKVYGDIVVGKLSVEPGSIYIGNCKMGGEKPAYEPPKTK